MKLTGKVALVTGGGTGIGLATAHALAGEGAAVAVNWSRSEAEAAAAVDALRKAGARAMAVRADVSVDAEVTAMIDRVAAELGRLDVLINNAATTRFIDHADLDALDEATWDRTFDVNVKGCWFCCRAAAKRMRAQGTGGAVVNVASIAGLNGNGSSVAYCASKAAVITMTKSLARALAPDIRVNAVAPGFIESRWTAEQHAARERHRAATPLRRNGRPEDIAGTIVHLAAADWITGETVVIDGGRTLA
jgi:3-oxoacyl-[acyl-carrier protein] reductase